MNGPVATLNKTFPKSLLQELKEANAAAKCGLVSATRSIKEMSDVIDPLKKAVDAFDKIIEILEGV